MASVIMAKEHLSYVMRGAEAVDLSKAEAEMENCSHQAAGRKLFKLKTSLSTMTTKAAKLKGC